MEFKRRMIALVTIKDVEKCHMAADELMCEMLKRFGFEEGVEIFQKMFRYYA